MNNLDPKNFAEQSNINSESILPLRMYCDCNVDLAAVECAKKYV